MIKVFLIPRLVFGAEVWQVIAPRTLARAENVVYRAFHAVMGIPAHKCKAKAMSLRVKFGVPSIHAHIVRARL
eukprot:6534156-Alexandrium_andersonii.AAC.1